MFELVFPPLIRGMNQVLERILLIEQEMGPNSNSKYLRHVLRPNEQGYLAHKKPRPRRTLH